MVDTLTNKECKQNFLSTSLIIYIESPKHKEYSYTKIVKTARKHFAHPVNPGLYYKADSLKLTFLNASI